VVKVLKPAQNAHIKAEMLPDPKPAEPETPKPSIQQAGGAARAACTAESTCWGRGFTRAHIRRYIFRCFRNQNLEILELAELQLEARHNATSNPYRKGQRAGGVNKLHKKYFSRVQNPTRNHAL
jgi:hypothetical protein